MLKFNSIKTLTAGVALAMAFYPQAWAVMSGTCGSSYTACHYTLTDDGVLTIQGNGAIGSNAFCADYKTFAKQIKNVVIEKGITAIGYNAFTGSGINSISIPNTVTSIGASAFYDVNLPKIVIPKSVTSIGSSAFLYTVVKDITIEGENVQFADYNSIAFGLYYSNVDFNVIEGSNTEKRLKELIGSNSRAKFHAYIPPKRTHYTIEEAMEHVSHDNHNTITFTFK